MTRPVDNFVQCLEKVKDTSFSTHPLANEQQKCKAAAICYRNLLDDMRKWSFIDPRVLLQRRTIQAMSLDGETRRFNAQLKLDRMDADFSEFTRCLDNA